MPVKIAICDDTREDILQLTSALHGYDTTFEFTTFTSGEEMLLEFANSNHVADILFLDIYMPGIDGILAAQRIRAQKKDIKIIFLSSSREHYPQAYEVFAFNYIVKPFDKAKLYTVLDQALEELGRANTCKIGFNYKSISYSVACRDILYVESQNKLLCFHLSDGRDLQCYGRLDDIITDLPEQSFLRCHQSFLVNISHISEMGENYFRVGQVLLSISRKYLKSSKSQYYEYLFSKMGERRTL